MGHHKHLKIRALITYIHMRDQVGHKCGPRTVGQELKSLLLLASVSTELPPGSRGRRSGGLRLVGLAGGDVEVSCSAGAARTAVVVLGAGMAK